MYQFVKRKILDLYTYNVLPRLEALHAEQIYQGIFDTQCSALGVPNRFYPVGASASYGLMYLLMRVFTELPVSRIIEFGSGQTTLLIDRIRPEEGCHVAYEQSALWAAHLRTRLQRCDLRERPIVGQDHGGVQFHGYDQVEHQNFDLLIVDGPNQMDHLSRYSCVPLIEANRAAEFVVIVDDADRPGEQETIAHIRRVLEAKSIDFKLNYLRARTTQALITTPKFRAASYFF